MQVWKGLKRWPGLISSSETILDKCWSIMSMKPFRREERTVPLRRQVCCCSGFTSKVRGVDLSRVNICAREMGSKSLKGNSGFLLLWHSESKHRCLSECPSWPNLTWIAWNFLDCHIQVFSPCYLMGGVSSAELRYCDLPSIKGYRLVSLSVTRAWVSPSPWLRQELVVPLSLSLLRTSGVWDTWLHSISTSLCFRRHKMLLHWELWVHVCRFIVALVNKAGGITLSHL